jgi:hypothetical protein
MQAAGVVVCAGRVVAKRGEHLDPPRPVVVGPPRQGAQPEVAHEPWQGLV